MSDFTILLVPDEELQKNNNWTLTCKLPNCLLCNAGFFYVHEYTYASTSGKYVCERCVLKKDSQLINIMKFICKHSHSRLDRLNKFNLGIPKLREMIAVSDDAAEKCPICEKRGVRYKTCLLCGFVNLGSGLFRYEDKVFNYYKAKRALKLKAFL